MKHSLSTDHSESARPVIVWFRQDLRVADQPALAAAVASGRPVVPLYVFDDAPGRWRLGGASRWWLHHSLQSLGVALAACGSRLVLRQGRPAEVIGRLVAECRADRVFCTRHVEPSWHAAERAVADALASVGARLEVFGSTTLFSPGCIVGRDGRPLSVFTPFWRACLAAPPPEIPLPAPRMVPGPACLPDSENIADWRLLPTNPDWAGGLRASWQPGEASAIARLVRFVDTDIRHYGTLRDRPEPAATSQLSASLHWGEISVRQVWHAASLRRSAGCEGGVAAFLREIGWREFCAHALVRHPASAEVPIQASFAHFPWAGEATGLRAWQRGRTGYPIVDAGMRQLWATGWMHNRVRMITASFLTKHLLVPWQEGEAWFWDTLVDADVANNAGGWQWIAGCGADAAPYFRIFNPVLQARKFDREGAYVRRWLPELRRLAPGVIHAPWEAPPLDLAEAGVRLGRDYPRPIVDHAAARERALAAFAAMKRSAATGSSGISC